MIVGRLLTTAAIALAVATGAAHSQQPAGGGRMVPDTLHSRAIEHNLYGDTPERPMLVYLPPSYSASSTRRYPVVYLLHGYGGDERTWVSFVHVKPTMDSLVRAGTVREMILVMPSGKNALDGSFYTNSVTTGNWDDFISQELVAYIDGKYRTIARPESRGLAGHSMGGFGTFVLGMRHAGDVYGALYAMSGCCTHPGRTPFNAATWAALDSVHSLADTKRLSFLPHVMVALAAALSPDEKAPPLFFDLPFTRRDGNPMVVERVYRRWLDQSPLDMIPRYSEKLTHLRGFTFDVGTSDDLVPLPSLAAMDSALTREGVKHTFETYDGNHVNRIALRFGTHVLPFFSQTLDFTETPRR